MPVSFSNSTKIGHSVLSQRIINEIARLGPMTFARFMEMALYDPNEGYYMTVGTQASGESTQDSRIGWSGDFYTSSDVHPLLAQCLIKQIREMDELLGRPSQLTVVEMGPGKGLLARDVLRACVNEDADLSARLTYVLIERSPVMQKIQAHHLGEFLEKGWPIEWHTSLSALDQHSVHGVMLCNELVDALPVHRVRVSDHRIHEVFVDFQGGTLCEHLGELSTSDIQDYLACYTDGLSLKWPDGYSTEVHLELLNWMEEVARVLQRGFVLTIDYGHTASDYYDMSRKDGTLVCYHKHTASSNPFVRVGDQDITAHVNFSALAGKGTQIGLSVTGFTNLMNFLLGLGADEMLADVDPESEEMQSAIQFLRPQSMGQTFKFLVQHKAIESPTLAGLKFRPFFEEALLGVGSEH
ncbi:MAG: SAM-dependent methyltransferase [Nitrospirales bacterium]|nr:MAG: SAM-dependent methyltransferase [Nitrospirales bacterium]